ncbi:MAG: biotin--[acetyl-CoA-carboxylase] ligase [Burkholderiaceae bacterium]|nr:biotin--[acetyl-CoA-carboxylase] ligase [Burkholderiaceae bacterium]
MNSGRSAAQEVTSVGAIPFERIAQIDSTNSELMRRARAGRIEPVLLAATHQTAGRGRMGRDWLSSAGDSLTFSLGLQLAPMDWAGLSLAVGVSVAESLDPGGHAGVQLKWPNDLWLRERKLGGILVETASHAGLPGRYVVIGVGLNIAPRPAAGASVAPAWLREIEPAVDAEAALQRIAGPLVQAVLDFERLGFAAFLPRFAARDLLRGRTVTVSQGIHGTLQGLAAGVAEDGALLVHTPDGMKHIHSSEVSVRPLGDAPA